MSGRIDHPMLHPKLEALLEQDRGNPAPPLSALPMATARAAFREMASSVGGTGPEMGRVEDVSIAVAGGSIPLRLYRPVTKTAGTGPTTVFFHGGGWVFGDLDSHDTMCRQIAHHGGTMVVSVGYRLAPEHKFPGPVDDCVAACEWVIDHQADLGGDGRLALAGDSAGGNLALAAAITMLGRRMQVPDFLLLLYPVTDLRGATMSRTLFGQGYWLDNIDYQTQCYIRGEADRLDPLGSPSLYPDLHLLPPVRIVTAGFDPLRDEAESLGRAIIAAGGSAETVRHAEYVHGFLSLPALLPEVASIMAGHASALGSALRAAKDS
jgi:acetyl esterase